VAEVRVQAWPQPRDAEDLHEALLWMGYATDAEAAEHHWQPWLAALGEGGRAQRTDDGRWFATEATRDPLAVLRGRLEALGPIVSDDPGLLALEHEGSVLRSRLDGQEVWCNRRLLARIHRFASERRRRAWRPVGSAAFLRFLARWQGLHPDQWRDGPRGVAEVVGQLAGFAVPGPLWATQILARRVRGFRHEWLDQLCLTGELAWGRLWTANPPATGRSALSTVPICLLPRADLDMWLRLAPAIDETQMGSNARAVLHALDAHGAQFQEPLVRASGLLPEYVEMAQAELIATGLITCDSFAALRWLLLPSDRRRRALLPAGRWSRLRRPAVIADPVATAGNAAPPTDEALARFVVERLLRRTGVILRQTIERERQPVPWRDLLRVLRLMELSGEVHGGRFVAGFSGEQYALPAAAEALRQEFPEEPPLTIATVDPLNFHGILLPDAKIAASGTRTVPLV
jgi:ATP-dependent Lhr-like helicase